MAIEERHFELNWDEDFPKVLELVDLPEGFDKEAMTSLAIQFLIGA